MVDVLLLEVGRIEFLDFYFWVVIEFGLQGFRAFGLSYADVIEISALIFEHMLLIIKTNCSNWKKENRGDMNQEQSWICLIALQDQYLSFGGLDDASLHILASNPTKILIGLALLVFLLFSISSFENRKLQCNNCYKIPKYDALSIYFYSNFMHKKVSLKLLSKYLNEGSQVVVRADFNVPIKDGKILDLNRVKSTIPTLQYLASHNPKSIVLLSHLGRPNGQVNQKFSLRPVVQPLQQLLGRPVNFIEDCVGEGVVNQINNSQGQIFLCENVRFHPEEEGVIKDKDGRKLRSRPEKIEHFRRELTRLGNLYVNDAFGCAHRAHSSVVGVQHPIRAAGLLLEKELHFLGGFLESPKKPVLVILGGAKVTDKIELILNMLNVADELIIGGGMSGPFLKEIYGHRLGSTKIVMPQNPKLIRNIINTARERGVKIHLPIDGVCAQTLSPHAPTAVFKNEDIPQGWEVFDKGPQTLEMFDEVVQRASSIFWNGPIGVFEFPNFKNGSETLLQSVINRTKRGGVSIIGGGDTANLVNSLGLEDQVSYVSTGGGATLQFMQGISLPGVQALSELDDLRESATDIII